jgi:hypothetical protein
MVWYIIGAIIFAVAIALLLYRYIMDRRFEKANVYDSLGADVREDLDEEIESAYARRDKFNRALEEATEQVSAKKEGE